MCVRPPRSRTIAVLCICGIMGFGVRVAAVQTITVTGRTLDVVLRRVIAGAEITIGSRTVVTDSEGRFQFDVSLGPWKIEIRARDYAPRTITFDATTQGVAPIEIELIPKEGFQERLEVTAPAPPLKNRQRFRSRRARCSRPPAVSIIRS